MLALLCHTTTKGELEYYDTVIKRWGGTDRGGGMYAV